MQIQIVYTRTALKRAIRAGVATIVIGPRLSKQILRVLHIKPACMVMSTIFPPIMYPPLGPILVATGLVVCALLAILYFAFAEDYEMVVEKDEKSNSSVVIFRKRQVDPCTSEQSADPDVEEEDMATDTTTPTS